MKQIWDISQTLRPGIAVWPGDREYQEKLTWELTDSCPVNVSEISMSTHTGTHADSPWHFAADGQTVAEVSLTPYLGPCRVIDLRGVGPLIEPHHFEAMLKDAPSRILFRTYQKSPDAWDENFTAISPNAMTRLGTAGVTLVGLDTPSLDPQDSKTLDAHKVTLTYQISILENLVLDAIEAGDYELIALPIKFANLDAAPVRAVLRSLS